MIRVTEFKMDGIEQPFKIASLTTAQAEEFATSGRKLAARGEDVAPDEWIKRQAELVSDSLGRAGMQGFSYDTIRHQLDLPTMSALYLKILEFSGLRAPGEVPAAASPSPKSAAA